MMLGSSGDIDASADQEREQTGEEPAQHGHEHLAKSEPQVDLSANGEVRVPIEFLTPRVFAGNEEWSTASNSVSSGEGRNMDQLMTQVPSGVRWCDLVRVGRLPVRGLTAPPVEHQ
jgi:hypothetical protein